MGCEQQVSLGWIDPRGRLHRGVGGHAEWARKKVHPEDPQYQEWRAEKLAKGWHPYTTSRYSYLLDQGWVAVTNPYSVLSNQPLRKLPSRTRKLLLELFRECVEREGLKSDQDVYVEHVGIAGSFEAEVLDVDEYLDVLGGRDARDEIYSLALERLESSPRLRLAKWKRRWKPGRKRRRQKGLKRTRSKQYYRRNRAKILRKQKLRRRKPSWKNNPARRRSEKLRKRQNRKMISSLLIEMVAPCPVCVADEFAERSAARFAPPAQRGGERGRPQRRQKPRKRREDARDYRSNKSRARMKAKRWYHLRCKKSPRCMKRRKLYRENPKRYQRRAPKSKNASVLTLPQISFAFGPDSVLGYVHAISPMTGQVVFRLTDPGYPPLMSLPVPVFLQVSTLVSDDDLDAFFNLVDVEVGLDAYEDLDEGGLRECALLYGIDPDSPGFKEKCQALPEDVDPLQVELVADSITDPDTDFRGTADAAEGDDSIPDAYDPHLFYGEVEDS